MSNPSARDPHARPTYPPPPSYPPPRAYPPPVAPPWPGHRQPSGLFPSRTSRPIYREPFPASSGAVLTGAGAGALWMLLFALIGQSVGSYCWWSIGAGLVAWIAAYVLARSGDRGVAAGVAMASGFGLAIAISVVTVRWAGGHWVLW